MDRVVSKRALAYLGAGLAAAAVYAVIPGESQRFAYPVFPLAASIATGLRARTASTHRASWWMLAVAFLLFACADVLYEVIAYTSFPGPPDVCFLAGFAVLTVAAFRFRELIQTYTAERSLDTLIAGTGAALVVWIVWVEPAATAVQASPGAAALALGYPVLDLMVLTLLVSGGPLRGSRAWLIAGTVGYLVGDTWWSVVSLKGTYETGIWPDAMWLWAYIAWGAAALDRTRPGRWDPQPFAVRARFILIGSLGLPTVALAFHEIRYQRLPESSVLIMAFVLGGLVLVRLQLAQRREWQANRQREQSFDALKKSLEREGHAVDAVLVLEQRNRSILDSAGEGIIGTNRDGITTFANPAAAAMLGRTVEELTGQKLSELIRRVHTDGAPEAHSDPQIMDMVAQGHDGHTENESFMRSDGSSFPVHYTATPIKEDGKQAGAVLVFNDISQQQQLEQELRQSQKMEALGALAGGVAHDFNNLLFVVRTNAALISEDFDEESETHHDAQEILTAADRASGLVRKLLTFSRKEVARPTRLDLNSIVAEAHKYLRRTVAENITIDLKCSDDLWPVRLDPVHAEQVLLNLVVNARDAQPDGGEIVIRTSNEIVDQPDNITGVEPGCYVCLSVADRGVGMSPGVRARIFEPFFSTKDRSKGTGLGLSTVYGIAKGANGGIAVDSVEGAGTVFRVFLPAEPDAEILVDAQEGPIESGHGELVLVVEDEESVRDSLCHMLLRAGYKVERASSPTVALEVFSTTPDIRLVITDIVMPGSSGFDLAEELLKQGVRVPILFMSGYSDQLSLSHRWDLVSDFLQKPFSSQDLQRKLNEMLTRDEVRATTIKS